MESVIHKWFNNRRKSSKLGFFCRKPSRTPAVIELPTKDVEKEAQDFTVVSRPPPDVRLVLFRECGETSDRRLLFDSKSFEPDLSENSSQNGSVNNNSKTPNGCRTSCLYQYVRGPPDSDILSEMLFGSVGMASRASSLKIHIKESSQLMLSRVFCVESMKETTVSLDRGMEYHLQNNRQNSVLSRRKAKTLPVPTPETPHIPPPPPQSLASSLTSRLTRSDSSTSLMSLTSLFGTSLSATGSLGSRSMPQSIPVNMRAHSLPPTTRQSSRDSFTLNQEPHHGMTSRKTKVKIGFAVIFQPEPSNSSEFQHFFFEHFPLIESYVTCLKEQVESALNTCKRTKNSDFIEAMMEALHVITQRVTAIYSTPRMPKPVWSSLTTMTSQRAPWLGDHVTVECFIADLTQMVAQHNTKNKSFFMSGLITAVLTNHLGWVNTMTPPSGENEAPMLAYNPLWAQLGDLYGAVGTPTKVAKTVVVGEIHALVSTIISILSYFIRCSNLNEVVQVPEKISPQTFLNQENLKMSSVPSDLETDYVLVSHLDDDDQPSVAKSPDSKTAAKKTSKTSKSGEKSTKFSFCSKMKKKMSEPTVAAAEPSESQGSTLCRSRSSPGTSTKPQLKFSRQKSSGNMEILPAMRLRTNSNDTFAKPRGVQSRRTSHDVTNVRRMSQSSSALVIPDSESSVPVSSLEGSKSLCLDPTPELGLLRKRLGADESFPGSLHEDHEQRAQKPPIPKRKLGPSPSCAATKSSLNKPTVQLRVKTHKRVSSEPFSVNQLPNICGDNLSSLIKTNSIYFDSGNAPVVRQMFVDRVEPRVVNVAHVQRSQPVIALNSPRSSPHLPRSKSSSGTKGPIIGFKTSEKTDFSRNRSKHLSGSCLPELATSNKEFKEVFSPKNTEKDTKIHFDDEKTVENDENAENISPRPRRSSSNLSSNGIIRRTSSNSSGKTRLAIRRRKLTGDSQKSVEENDEKDLPPLLRIPSISLNHDDFDEYFNDKEEVTFFGSETPKTVTSSDKETAAQSQPTVTENHSVVTETTSPPVQSQRTITETPQKAESRSTTTLPPPLPSVGPCHKSQSMKELHSSQIMGPSEKPTLTTPKVPPPLPKSPPVHRGSLYPKLDNVKEPQITPEPISKLPKTSLYPSLTDFAKSPYNENTEKVTTGKKISNSLYPNLNEEITPQTEPVIPKVYPRLPKCSDLSNLEKNLSRNFGGENLPEKMPENEILEKNDESDENVDYFTTGENVPLTPVTFSEEISAKTEKKRDEEEKYSRLTFAELLADYSPEYLWGFALHGTRNQSSLYMNIIHELQHSVSHPVLDEPVAEAVTILADTDKWTVQVLSSHRIHSDRTALPALTSKLITNILERITRLYMMKTPASFCLQQLENELGELVLKSRMLAHYVVGNTRVTMSQLSAVLGIESSDLPLLMAIASCHSPEVAAKLL